MSGKGNIKRFHTAESVNRPNCEDFKVYNVISEGLVRAMDCNGVEIPFWAGASADLNLGKDDLTQTDVLRSYNLDSQNLWFEGLGSIGFGVNNPTAKIEVKADALQDIINFKKSSNNIAFHINSDGDASLNTNINVTRGFNVQYIGKTYGKYTTGSNCAVATGYNLASGSTPRANWDDCQSTGAGNFVGSYSTCRGGSKTNASANFGSARNATNLTIGGEFYAGLGASVEGVKLIGVKGFSESPLNDNKVGGDFTGTSSSPAIIYTDVDFIGSDNRADAGSNVSNTGTRAIGARFNASDGVDANYGVWIETGDFRFDTSVVVTAGAVVGQIPINIGGSVHYIEVKQ